MGSQGFTAPKVKISRYQRRRAAQPLMMFVRAIHAEGTCDLSIGCPFDRNQRSSL